jgi:AraC-like DNA-binding protein
MATTTFRHRAIWAHQLVAELADRGLSTAPLLKELGLSEADLSGENARIPFAKYAALFERAAQFTGENCFGLHFGQTRDIRTAGLIGYVGLTSPNLSDGLDNVCRYFRVYSDALRLRLNKAKASSLLEWAYRGNDTPEAPQTQEFIAANLMRAIRLGTDRDIMPIRVTFAHPRALDIDQFEGFFRCPVTFGSRCNAIEMSAADLARPLVTADHRLLDLLRHYCEEAIARQPPETPPLVEQVKRAIADRLASGNASLDGVAAELGMSNRSLSRRLAGLGSSFNSLLDGMRAQLAERYLHESQLSCTEIAFVLGYSDVSSFNHAFKRWTGSTPTASRKAAVG